MRVVITEMIDPVGIRLLEPVAEVIYDPALWRSPELLSILKEATALVVRNQTRVTAELLEGCPSLQVVGRLGVGLDNVDLTAARQRGLPVVFARGANATAVAEYVLGAMLTLARCFGPANRHVLAGGWDREAFYGTELSGKTLGLIGLGDIGLRVALRARAFNMPILAYDPLLLDTSAAVAETGAKLVTLEEVLAQADFISIHVPLIKETRGLLDGPNLDRLKPTAVLINTSRGHIVDEKALVERLRKGRLGGAALDVFAQEPPDPAGWQDLPNLLVTPHVGGLTQESQSRTASLVCQAVRQILEGRPVNPSLFA
jgi:D-3-phosphoglycerate dehydrogenase